MDPYREWVDWMSGLGDGAHLLYAITRMTRPSVVVEIGSARGKSTCSFALACAENQHGVVFAIDPHVSNDWTDAGTSGHTLPFLRRKLLAYGVERFCTVISKTSEAAAPDWQRPIDILFIDGDHTAVGVRRDFQLFAPWVRDDGLIIFHDSGWEHEGPWDRFRHETWYRDDMGVPAFLDELQRSGYQGVTFMPLPGMTILHPRRGGFEFARKSGQSTHEISLR